MFGRFSTFLALRYLKPKRTFVSLITMITMLGVALGVAVPMVVISVMKGFELEIKRLVLGFEPHIFVYQFAEQENGSTPDWRAVRTRLKEYPEVLEVTPLVEGMVFVEFQDDPRAAQIQSVAGEQDARHAAFAELTTHGRFDMSGDMVVLGDRLARKLGVIPGDVLTLYAPSNVKDLVTELRKQEESGEEVSQEALQEMILPLDVEVVGIFESLRYGDFLLMPLHLSQELYDMGGEVHGLSVKIEDGYRAGLVREELEKGFLHQDWAANAWMERPQNAQQFAAVRNERQMMFFVLLIIAVVAGFCVMNTMITVTVQKRREIGIVGALGARPSQVVGVFLWQGTLVGVLGSLLGVALGWMVVRFRNEIREWIADVFDREIFPSEVYGVLEIPAKIQWADVGVITGCAMILCVLGALVPAWLASRVDPAQSLRQ